MAIQLVESDIQQVKFDKKKDVYRYLEVHLVKANVSSSLLIGTNDLKLLPPSGRYIPVSLFMIKMYTVTLKFTW